MNCPHLRSLWRTRHLLCWDIRRLPLPDFGTFYHFQLRTAVCLIRTSQSNWKDRPCWDSGKVLWRALQYSSQADFCLGEGILQRLIPPGSWRNYVPQSFSWVLGTGLTVLPFWSQWVLETMVDGWLARSKHLLPAPKPMPYSLGMEGLHYSWETELLSLSGPELGWIAHFPEFAHILP